MPKSRRRWVVEALESRTTPAVFAVTTTADVLNATDGVLSLREAVRAANATPEADTITVPAGSYSLTLTGASEDAALTGDLDLTGGVTLTGAGAANTIIDGVQADRVFDVLTGPVTLNGLTVTNGSVRGSNAEGGGIRAVAALRITNCAITNNTAYDPEVGQSITGTGFGGGISQHGAELTIGNSRIAGNVARAGAADGATGASFGGDAQGGGLYQYGGTLTLTDTTFADNRAQGGANINSTPYTPGGTARGGAVAVDGQAGDGSWASDATLTLAGCVFENNQARGGAGSGAYAPGGFAFGGAVSVETHNAQVRDSSFVGNTALGGRADGGNIIWAGRAFGGGIWFFPDSGSIVNSTVVGNSATGGAATGPWATGGDAYGGGIAGYGYLSNSTVVGNTVTGGAAATLGSSNGGGYWLSGTPRGPVTSSIVAGNSASNGPDVVVDSGAISSGGGNVIGVAGSGLTNGNGDQAGTLAAPLDPQLAPPSLSGGRPVRIPLAGSPAISKGSNSLGLLYDQRGAGYARVRGTAVDAGAVEAADAAPAAALATPADLVAVSGMPLQFTVTYTSDSGAIAVASLGTGDVAVTTPAGSTITPTLVGVATNTDGSPRTATYEIAPPGGSWDAADNGSFAIRVVSGQVSDTLGLTVPALSLGSFAVRIGQRFVVTTTGDNGTGSLRDALNRANAAVSTADTVSFDPTLFGVARTITLTSGALTIADPVVLEGPGAALLTLNGGGRRILQVGATTATLTGVTLANGSDTAELTSGGSALLNNGGVLDLQACALVSNSATGSGAAIRSLGGVLRLSDCTVTDNLPSSSSTAIGGAVAVENGVLLIAGGIYARNSSRSSGGAVSVSGSAAIANASFSGNSARVDGGVLNIKGPLTVSNSTLVDNRATGLGGAIRSNGGSVEIASSLIADNPAIVGSGELNTATSALVTNSLIGNPAGVTLAVGSGNNLPAGIDPRVGPLMTGFAPLPGSPVINAGSNPLGLTTDGRGNARVQGAAADVGAATGPLAGRLRIADPQNGATAQTITVNYAAVAGLSISSIGTGDLLVTGPNGFSVQPAFASVDTATDGVNRQVTYTFTPPGGSWDAADRGMYTVTLRAGEVLALGGAAAPAGELGVINAVLPQTLVVTTTAATGAGSLSAAVALANADVDTADTITFAASLYASPATITVTQPLTITDSLAIIGPGASKLAVSGGGSKQLLQLRGTGATVLSVSGLTLRNGRSAGSYSDQALNGGAIGAVNGNVVLSDCVFTSNISANYGGAVAFAGTGLLQVDRCQFTGNSATSGFGGAIYRTDAGPTALRQSVFQNNSASYGGGVYETDGTSVVVDGCSFTGNQASSFGRAASLGATADIMVFNSVFAGNNGSGSGMMLALDAIATVALRNTTVTNNDGTALSVSSSTLLVQNSTIVENGLGLSVTGSPVLTVASSVIAKNGTAMSAGSATVTHSAFGSYVGITLAPGSGDNIPAGTDLKLGPLADNGGIVQTRLPLAGSPLIDAGSNPANLLTDARGSGYARTSSLGTDIGAAEVQNSLTRATVRVNDGSASRSRVTALTVTFTNPVTLATGAFTLTKQGGATIPLTVDLTSSTGSQTVARLTFGGSLDAGSLTDGRYSLRVVGSQVTAANGFDGDGIAGGDAVVSLFRLGGDADGSGAVDAQDVTAFLNTYGASQSNAAYRADLDLDASGAVDAQDVTLFLNRYGVTLP